ncbi:thymidylate kinase [Zalerion maritima]|uniref:Thymidylate kinase n=1 Tax=Zalerion maritima TaxID=339359 RepID=A0AAD5RGQ9_9PEZI|nr:thymidylate kinase [Zalerion maritima]
MSDLTSLAAAAATTAASARAAGAVPSPSPSPAPLTPVRGSLIVLEGLDRSGKTTQVKLLEQRFVEAGRSSVKVMRFPDRTTPIGQMIDGYLRRQSEMDDHSVHLLFSANRWEAAKNIHALLSSGTTVICDRYYLSGMVYSTAKGNPSLPLAWARNPEVGLPRPDIVLFLDLDEETARGRGGWGGELYEKAGMQKKVRELFWDLSMGKTGEYRQEEEDLIIVDAGPSMEEVSEEIWRKVKSRVESVDRGEVGKTVRLVS